ncbi:hypothetical protein GCM10011414_28030 [Croceivirga lutea]|uniref:hypothetical protein n=1 Tax=Croceivirga lutea TaxID=1775167 RepID=UPI001639CE61|nr:hypothetical protein [Croceivirga lutea]GGG56587.1 hypothetical protein GCM10011414_28030 [Croceivirga lutea]
MQQKPFIEFKKQRELSDILTDTFNFIKFEFKPFFGTILKIVGPFLFAFLICMAFYLYSFNGAFNSALYSVNSNVDAFGASPILIIIAALGLFVTAIATVALLQASILYYVKSYTDNQGKIDFDLIKKESYKNFWRFVGLAILVGLAIVVGFMFCIIPGIYLYPPLMLAFSIMVFMNKSVSDSFSYAFTLIKDNWWITFATLFVIGIITAVIGYIVQLPGIIYMYAKMGIFSGEMDAESMGNIFDPIYILFNLISYLVQFTLQTVTVVASALIFFNLNEKKNFTGTMERIQNIGNTQED